MIPPFKDNVAIPLPGMPIVNKCPRSGRLNLIAYNSITADESMVDEGIAPGDFMYILSTADVWSGDLAAIKTPDGLFVRLVNWFADSTGKGHIRLVSANPEIKPREYEYDDEVIRTRWRVMWVCRHGDHSLCAAYKSPGRVICN